MNIKCADRPAVDKQQLPGLRAHRRARYLCLAPAVFMFSPTLATAQIQVPARVVSINLCTDQLLLALADPDQIAGLSRFSRHTEMSFLAARAARYPSLRGSAEEVLKMKPDLVLAGAYSGRATRAVLGANGVRVETFAPPESIAAATAEIERMAAILGRPQRGATLISEIDRAVTEATAAIAGRPAVSALAIQRRGFVSGRDTLLSSAMGVAGLTNASAALGITSIDRAPLETIVKRKPDVLVIEDLPVSRDQSTALLHHPVLVRAGIGSRVLRLPVAEVTCGGPSLPHLIRRLSREVSADARN